MQAIVLAAVALLATAAAAPNQPGTGCVSAGRTPALFDDLPQASHAVSKLPWGTVVRLRIRLCCLGRLSGWCAGNLLTSDFGGPYNLTLLPVQSNEIKSESFLK